MGHSDRHLPLFRLEPPPDPAERDGTVRLDRARQASNAATIVFPPAPAGSGALLRCAWPLVATLDRIAAGYAANDVSMLKREVVALVQGFGDAALAAGIAPGEAAAARYILCTALDEAVQTSVWGERGEWNAPSLLSQFHGETWGGETVFAILERALDDRAAHGGLLEVGHMVLLLGFQGRFRRERDGTAQADAVRARLQGALWPAPPPEPPPLVVARPPRRRELFRFAPVWTVAVFAVLISASAFAWLRSTLEVRSVAVEQALRAMPDAGGAAPAAGGARLVDAAPLPVSAEGSSQREEAPRRAERHGHHGERRP